jgi:hypothetical protein
MKVIVLRATSTKQEQEPSSCHFPSLANYEIFGQERAERKTQRDMFLLCRTIVRTFKNYFHAMGLSTRKVPSYDSGIGR